MAREGVAALLLVEPGLVQPSPFHACKLPKASTLCVCVSTVVDHCSCSVEYAYVNHIPHPLGTVLHPTELDSSLLWG